MTRYRIVNIVADTDVSDKLDLIKINAHLDNCEYEPEVYFALIYRLSQPKLSILVNKSGKIIFTGAKSLKDIENARIIFFDELFFLGYTPQKNDINIQNIVITSELNSKINISKVVNLRSDIDIKYNPKTYHGIIYKNDDPKFTALIFKSGKFSIVGLKKFEYIDVAVKLISDIFNA